MGAVIGDEVPLWDIREDFPQEEGMLIVNNAIGSSLAKRLGEGRACLLASHGAVIVEATIRRVVQVAISLVTNAELFVQARLLAGTQDVRELRLLSGGEIRVMTELLFSPRALERMWEYWATRAGYGEGEATRI
jgi:ribulose-5-phosphate 4-epimerase/fuculose-1-phosphate aldolase